MKRTLFIFAISIMSALLIKKVYATVQSDSYQDALNEAYNAFVIEGKNSVTIESDCDLASVRFTDDLFGIDTDSSLYDGEMLAVRGNSIVTKKESIENEMGNAKYTIILEGAYDINAADELSNKIVDEIKGVTGENATERQKLYEIMNYMANNYKYDHTATELYQNDNSVDFRKNFVDAYYSDKYITCTGYASLVYLLANKMGLDCRIIGSKNHEYNIIKFSDSNKYYIVDAASGDKNAFITKLDVMANDDMYTISSASKGNNPGIDSNSYAGAPITEVIKLEAYNLGKLIENMLKE